MEIMDNVKTKKASILIVEDNHLDILVLKVLLGKHFNLCIVTNGEDALYSLKEFEFDVVLMDINLENPLMDGLQVMKKIREDKKTADLKIFAVTAYADNKEDLVAKGFNDVLIKPVVKEEIFEILNDLELIKNGNLELVNK